MTDSENCTGPQRRYRLTSSLPLSPLSQDVTAVPNPISLARGRLGSWGLQIICSYPHFFAHQSEAWERGPEARLLIFWERALYSFCLQPFSLHPLSLVHSCPSLGASAQASYLRKAFWTRWRRWMLLCVCFHALHMCPSSLKAVFPISLWRPDVTVTQFSVQSLSHHRFLVHVAGMFPFLACRWPLLHGLDASASWAWKQVGIAGFPPTL